MPLESLTGPSVFIDALVVTNPAGADDRREGDDHIRGVKNVLKNTFPNINAAVTLTDEQINAAALTTGATFAAGTAAAPTVRGTGATTSGLYWPGTDQFGISTAGVARTTWSDVGKVEISSAGVAAGQPTLEVRGSSNTERMWITSAGQSPVYAGMRANGSLASPTVPIAGDDLASFQGGGWDTTQYVRAAWLQVKAEGTWSSTSRPTGLELSTTPAGSTTIAARVLVSNAGNFTVNAPSSGVHTINGGTTFTATSSMTQTVENTSAAVSQSLVQNWRLGGVTRSSVNLSADGGGNLTLRFSIGNWEIETNPSNDQLRCNGSQVLTSRRTGWGAPTGTATRTTFATGTVTLPQLAERLKALIDDLTTHGVIGA